ncbi:MAG: anhydro-N-acetylmuramic acid kinase [Gammaproteobacteria bacterium]|nr:anhydro-N-acetylmuramic acid kinase [Gammaproteobacteria bacterium]
MPRLFLGAISGTSVDGLDLALVDVEATTPVIVDAHTVAFPNSMSDALIALAAPGTDEVVRLATADAELGTFIGEAINAFLGARTLDPTAITAIGSHGQTVRHSPDSQPPFTVQIGDPNRIAELTGIDCVADFRRRDMAAGGEGAPLVPPFHDALFRSASTDRVVLNIGGISNITVLVREQPVSGFDTGPGNALLDAWIRANRNEPFDADGAWAALGKPDAALMGVLQRDPYLARPPPKSTGKEHYHLGFIERALGSLSIDPANVQATLAAFTACSVSEAVTRWGPESGEVVVCGGGRNNRDLMARLTRELAGFKVMTSEDLGINGDAVEAALFAWLAHRYLAHLGGNAPSVTGATGDRVLGVLAKA